MAEDNDGWTVRSPGDEKRAFHDSGVQAYQGTPQNGWGTKLGLRHGDRQARWESRHPGESWADHVAARQAIRQGNWPGQGKDPPGSPPPAGGPPGKDEWDHSSDEGGGRNNWNSQTATPKAAAGSSYSGGGNPGAGSVGMRTGAAPSNVELGGGKVTGIKVV